MSDVSITTIFCDDIRTEVGGKYSLMGIYAGNIELPEVPCLVPKIVIFIIIDAPAEFSSDTITVALQMSDGNESRIPVRTQLTRGKTDKSVNERVQMHVALEAIPFEVTQQGIMHVQILVDGKEDKKHWAGCVNFVESKETENTVKVRGKRRLGKQSKNSSP